MVPHFALCGTMIKADLHMGANQYYEHRFFKDQFQNTVQPPQPPLVAHNAKSSQSTAEICRNAHLTTTPRSSSEQDGGLKGCAIVEQRMSKGPTRGFVFIGPVFLSIIFMYASLTVPQPQRWRVADLVKTSPLVGTMARATFNIQRPCITQLLLQVVYIIF